MKYDQSARQMVLVGMTTMVIDPPTLIKNKRLGEIS